MLSSGCSDDSGVHAQQMMHSNIVKFHALGKEACMI